MINLGQKVQFNPMDGIRFTGCSEKPEIAIGKVMYINKPHRWFSVVYGDGDRCRTSFHFCDIGTKVHMV